MKAIFPALALAFAVAAVPLCAQAAAPDTAPGDSARHAWRIRLRREFRASMIAHGIAQPDALLLLSRDRTSGPMQVSVLEGAIPAGVLAALDTVIDAEPLPPEVPETMLLRPEDDAEPEFGSGDTPADTRNTVQIGRILSRWMSGHPEMGVPGQRFYGTVRMVLTRNGTIPYAQVERSTGSARVDEGVLAAVKKIRARPPRVDGRLVDTWIVIPVTLEILPDVPPPTGNAPGLE